ncbi:hydroxymethylglutaryl-CoA reductase [Flavobacterium silvaticum]|uniref:hydroxymethylglutaryl-CoA reductase (NADPH) n=1 Tax=Flavobacterium silvaticum TaxID=1852020 RepID=A0A972JHW1_9FLAO|nr:hydroxymethylglutaryl-CoA reductase [Flavobacterium silvaticum]NMH27553.1 hydroxymethylglutaryl-CoA reductase [Flavobacterium silvaticum]
MKTQTSPFKTKPEKPNGLFGNHRIDAGSLQGNIENFIGMAMVPTGIIGPVKVLGSQVDGEFMIPLSTTEGALVASYNRGAKACFEAGGVTSVCVNQGVQRCPVFRFSNLREVLVFSDWALGQVENFREITSQSSRFARLIQLRSNIEGNHLTLTFEFTTGDASGQNMVTFCTESICHYILENTPVQPQRWFVEGNYAGDKKATALSFSNVRGKKVVSEIILPKSVVENTLKTTPKAMADYWVSSTLGVVQSGAIGLQGHYANGLAALYIATGQDVACVSESAIGITRMEILADGSLYASVTLPGLIVGTVGGGTGLPTQKQALELMECYGEGKAVKFAEIIGAVILGGELSIAAALSAGHFSSAHKKFGRKNNQ